MTSVPLSEFEGQGKSAKFEQIGDTHAGVIVNIEQRQQTDLKTGKLKWWNDDPAGRPMMQWLITIDEAGENVVLYARGGNFTAVQGEGESMQAAIVRAVRAAGGESVAQGARLAVKHSGLAKATEAGFNAPKLFTAQYQLPAAPSVPVDLFQS